MSSPIVHLDELQFTRDMRHSARFEATFSGKFVPEGASVEYWDGE